MPSYLAVPSKFMVNRITTPLKSGQLYQCMFDQTKRDPCDHICAMVIVEGQQQHPFLLDHACTKTPTGLGVHESFAFSSRTDECSALQFGGMVSISRWWCCTVASCSVWKRLYPVVYALRDTLSFNVSLVSSICTKSCLVNLIEQIRKTKIGFRVAKKSAVWHRHLCDGSNLNTRITHCVSRCMRKEKKINTRVAQEKRNILTHSRRVFAKGYHLSSFKEVESVWYELQ